MNKYNYLYSGVATKGGKTREVQITDDSDSSAQERLSRMNQGWKVELLAFEEIDHSEDGKTIFC